MKRDQYQHIARRAEYVALASDRALVKAHLLEQRIEALESPAAEGSGELWWQAPSVIVLALICLAFVALVSFKCGQVSGATEAANVALRAGLGK